MYIHHKYNRFWQKIESKSNISLNKKHMEQTPEIIEKIAIRDLDGEVKSHIAQTMIDDVETTLEYWSQMFLAVVVATL